MNLLHLIRTEKLIMLFILYTSAVYLAWRLWRFTIRPRLHPDEPKTVPYWIPFIGPAISFRDFDQAVTDTISKFNSKAPFSVTLYGSPLYIITDPIDAAQVNRHSRAFALEPLAKQMFVKFGISELAVERLFRPDPSFSPFRGSALHAVDQIIELYRAHISPSNGLDSFVEDDITPRIARVLSPDALATSTTASLHELCVSALVNPIVSAYYGDIILRIQPHFAERYMAWEKTSWKFLLGLPKFMSKDMLAAKRDMVGVFVEYFSLSPGERGHENLWVSSVERTLRDLDLTNEEIGRIFMLHTSSIIGNMYKLSFWLLAHILHNAALLNDVSLEVKPAFNPETRVVDHTYLTESCPRLDSLYSEVLRLVVSSPMTRQVTADTAIGDVTVPKGAKVLIMYRHLHHDTATWGPTPEVLQPERFLHDKALGTRPAYRPWGAGKHVCPGRFLAKKAVFAVVALILGQFDISVDKDAAFPQGDLKKASGVTALADGEDVLVSMRLNNS
ncbi:putative cytochrome P450 [Aspergillus unguis]